MPGAERWQPPLSAAVALSHPVEPIAARELDKVFDDPSLDELSSAEDEIMEVDDLDISEADEEKTVIAPAPTFAFAEKAAAEKAAAEKAAADKAAAEKAAAEKAAAEKAAAEKAAAEKAAAEKAAAEKAAAEKAAAEKAAAEKAAAEKAAAEKVAAEKVAAEKAAAEKAAAEKAAEKVAAEKAAAEKVAAETAAEKAAAEKAAAEKVAAEKAAAEKVAAEKAAAEKAAAEKAAAEKAAAEKAAADQAMAARAMAPPVVVAPVIEENTSSWFEPETVPEKLPVEKPRPFEAIAAPVPAPKKSGDAFQFSWDDVVAPENIRGGDDVVSDALPSAESLAARGAFIADSEIAPDPEATAVTQVAAQPSLFGIPPKGQLVEESEPAAAEAPSLHDEPLQALEAPASEDAAANASAALPNAPVPEIERAELAPLWQRGLAGLVDLIPVAGATALALVALEPTLSRAHLPLLPHSLDELARMWWALNWKVAIIIGAMIGSAFIYQLLTFVYMQGTVGDFLFGIVWITRRGRRPGLVRALWRASWFIISFVVCGAGYWFALLTHTRRPLYDWVSGVYPVKRRSLVFPPAPVLSDAPAVS